MKTPWGWAWLLAAAGLALSLALLAAGLRQDIGYCIARSGGLDLTPDRLAGFAPATLGSALARFYWQDLVVFGACLAPLALSALSVRGRRQWLLIGATLALAVLIAWHLRRSYVSLCRIPDLFGSSELGVYLFPSLLAWLLLRRIGDHWAQRAGE